MIAIMPWKAEVFVKGVAFRAVDIGAMSIDSFVPRWLRLPNILVKWAFQTISKIDHISATAVKVMPYFELFPGVVAYEIFR